MQSMNKISARLAVFKKKALCLAFAAVFAQPALANPVGPNVAAGSATFATNGNTLTVTNSPGTVINWQQFNINQNETTRFAQQSAQSAVLNRIGGQNASQILGTLTSNGRVYLVNPNGVMFGQGAVIDVAGLIVSSLNLSDANFLANKLIFNGGGFGAVTNLGTITTPLGGSVYLIGSNVGNQGVITSPQGQVLLAAGSSVSLIDSAGPELSVTLTANGNKAVNLGTITAAGGHIDMFGALIEQAGVLRADSATVDAAGNITLKATQSTTVSGEISATNSVGSGGKVQVLGDQVALTSTAKIDASGVGAAGTALIGGDYKGGNAAVQNATLTTLAAGATIKADGLDSGNGGRVIIWSDDKTVFDGFISARGGANGGDGGFVETSGKRALSVAGQVNTLAPKGKTGMWLLDPTSYCLGIASGCGIDYSAASLAAMLNGSDVTLDASDYISVVALDFGSEGFTRWNPTLILKAPAISLARDTAPFAVNGVSSNNSPLNLEVYASGTSASFPSNSGKIIVNGDIVVGNSSVGGDLLMKADSAIEFANTHASFPISLISSSGGFMGGPTGGPGWPSGELILAAPIIALNNSGAGPSNVGVNFGTVAGGNGGFYVATDRLSGTGRFDGEVRRLFIGTYSSGRDIYLGYGTSEAVCGSALCITNQFAGGGSGLTPYLAVGTAGIMAASPFAATAAGLPESGAINDMSDPDWVAGLLKQVFTVNAPPTGNLYIGGSSSWNVSSKNGFGIYAKDITVNSGHHINAAGWSSSDGDYPLMLVATNRFINLGEGVINQPAGKSWGILVGNLAGSTFGTFAADAKTMTFRDALVTDFSASSNTNVIIDLNLTTSDGLCSSNPSACLVPENPIKSLDDQTANNLLAPFDSTAIGSLTFAANLNVITGSATKADTSQTGTTMTAKGVLTVAAGGKDNDKKKKDDVKRERQETRAAEERKSSTELKREAQEARAEAKKLDGEAKKTAAESKKFEVEAKKAEGEQKKAEVEHKRAETEAKKAEESGKKADAEAKQHDGEAKQAANEAKSAKSVDAKVAAEARKAEAEGKKADAEGRKTEAESKTVVAEGKKLEVEHKRADSEAKHTEAEHKRVESESKQAESSSKKAEAEHKLAVAEAKEAKTPQQKVAAEKRAEDKRVEAIQEKAKAEVKKEHAEVKKAEVEAKKAESEQKKTESDSKKIEAESKRAEVDSRKSESQAKKSEADGKRAEADSAKAKQAGKGDDQKKAELKKAGAEKKQVEQEKKAQAKKVESEKKQTEADGKKREAEQKKAQAEQKKLVAEKKQAERREKAVKSFAKTSVASMAPERLAQVIAMRHEHKTESFKPALNILERNPAAANLPACGSGGGDVCAPAKVTAQQVAQQIAQIPAPRIPKVSFLPQIERKIAIVVAINNYKDRGIPSLESAVPDGDAVGKLMQDKLGYDVRVIHDAGKADIVKALNAVGREVGPNDSVTVYYAGHGYQMDGKSGGPGEGYWIPADGSSKEPSNWISNSDVSKLLANIPAKQVMLVSDSCYSGAFTKEQKITASVSADPAQILAKRSVVVMSSGGEEPVSDEGKEGHSIFAWSLMNSMKNVDKFDTGSKLYEGVRKQVIEEFPQVPQYGAATSAGHVQGGDYLFEARRY
ncbi:MAG: caspase family protein [Sulfuritalea sp.]|jgi:filamentous hemagglutinin family protein|nr:caspase family protein [Sulfuritalea sp.]